MALTSYSETETSEVVEPNGDLSVEDAIKPAEKPEETPPGEESPFAYACKGPKDLVGRPETGLHVRSIPLTDNNSVSSKAFFAELLEAVESYAQANIDLGDNIAYCLDPKNKQKQCDELRQWSRVEVPAFIKEARYQLAMSEGPHSIRRGMGGVPGSVNTKLNMPTGTYKEVAWDPLTKEEKIRPNNSMKAYKADIINHMGLTESYKKHGFHYYERRAYADSLYAVKSTHYGKYKKMMTDFPFMHHLHSPQPNFAEIRQAALDFTKNARNEIAGIKRTLAQIKALSDHENVPIKALTYMNYSSLAEGLLLMKPKYCKVAASAFYTGVNRGIGNAVVVGAPVLAVSLFAPPTWAAVGAGGVATVYAVDSYYQTEEAKQRMLSEVYGSGGLDDIETMAKKKSDMYVDIASVPLSFTGAGVLAKLKIPSRLVAFYNRTLKSPTTSINIPAKYRAGKLPME